MTDQGLDGTFKELLADGVSATSDKVTMLPPTTLRVGPGRTS